MPTSLPGHLPTLLLFTPIAIAVGVVAYGPPLSDAMAPLQGLLLLGGVAWLVALRRARKGRLAPAAVVFGAIVLRLLAFGGEPRLSDDVYRYAWEGGLVLEGISPYASAPQAEDLREYRERWEWLYVRMNNRDVSAAYPPVTQAACAAVVAAVGGNDVDGGRRAVRGMRAFFGACDLLVLIPLAALARRRKLPPAVLVAWAWCPLVALEFAGSGHFDSLGILLLVAALSLLEERDEGGALERNTSATARRAMLGWIALAGAILVKYLPVVSVPFALRRGPRILGLAWLALLCVLCFGGIALLDGGTRGLGAGLSAYGLRWDSTNLAYRWIEAPLDGWLGRDGSWSDPRRVGRLLAASMLVAVALFAWVRGRSTLRATALCLGAFLILTPTLHPWYVTWIAPFLALAPWAAFELLLLLAPLLYWPLEGWIRRAEWTEPPWLWPVIALPFFLLLIAPAARPRLEGLRVRLRPASRTDRTAPR